MLDELYQKSSEAGNIDTIRFATILQHDRPRYPLDFDAGP